MANNYYTSPFGNGVLSSSGGNVVENVHNHFGVRDTGETIGVNKVEGVKEELMFNLTAELINGGALKPFVLPGGAVITAVYLDVEEAFVLTGTTPSVKIGTAGSEATNGFSISEAQIEATGSVNLTSTLAGTWDAEVPLAANTTVGFALAGTGGPAITGGKARITVLFDRINRAPSPAKPGGPVLP